MRHGPALSPVEGELESRCRRPGSVSLAGRISGSRLLDVVVPMSPETYALLLMIIGFALIVAEVFIPSGGLILILCVISFTSSIWFAYKAWWGVSDGIFWTYIAALVVLIPGATIAAFRFLESSSIGRRVLLPAPTQEEVTPHQREVSRLTALIGQRGKALTLMTPGGMVLVGGERLHAISEGTLISPNEAIEVIGVKGTRVVVRTIAGPWVSEAPPRRNDGGSGGPSGDETSPPLDFDFPPS